MFLDSSKHVEQGTRDRLEDFYSSFLDFLNGIDHNWTSVQCIEIKHLFATFCGWCADNLTFNSEWKGQQIWPFFKSLERFLDVSGFYHVIFAVFGTRIFSLWRIGFLKVFLFSTMMLFIELFILWLILLLKIFLNKIYLSTKDDNKWQSDSEKIVINYVSTI